MADYQLTPELNYETVNVTINSKLPNLPIGEHTIQIEVYFTSFYHPTDIPHDFYGWWATVVEDPNVAASEIVQFNVAKKMTAKTFFIGHLCVDGSVIVNYSHVCSVLFLLKKTQVNSVK